MKLGFYWAKFQPDTEYPYWEIVEMEEETNDNESTCVARLGTDVYYPMKDFEFGEELQAPA